MYFRIIAVTVFMEHFSLNEFFCSRFIKDVFPDYITEIEEDELEYYPGKKVGDKIIEPYFTDEQFEDICKIDNNPIFNRIQLIKNLYTDKPYTILDGCSYIE